MLIALYLLYLAFSIALTIWVGQTLFRNGRAFLVEAFDKPELADSVNHLLIVGFYLINLGYVTMTLKSGLKPDDSPTLIELLSAKVGVVSLVLGGMHFFNLYVFSRIRSSRTIIHFDPPVAPDAVL